MPFLNIIIILIIAGVLLWVVNSLIPMDPKIRSIVNVVVVLGVVIWLLRAFRLINW